jgi:HlyD family secretion protein
MQENLPKKIKAYIVLHKVKSVFAVIILSAVGYWSYGKATSTSGETLYTTTEAVRGTIISSISGSGQVSASDQIEVKPKASGDVTYIGFENGQLVSQGGLIAKLDTTDPEKAVRDAERNLETAKLSLEKILKPADTLSIIQAENALTSAKQSKTRAEDDLILAYDDALTAISNAFIDLPPIINGIQDILYKNTNNTSQDNISFYTDLVKNYDATVFIYRDSAATNYQLARTAYDKNFLKYKSISRYADRATIESLLSETAVTARALTDSVKSSSNLLSFVKDKLTERNSAIPALLTTHQTSIDAYTTKTNASLADLTSSINEIKNTKDTLQNSDSTIKEKTESLAKLRAGSDELDVRSARISITQREDALQDAKDNLAKYYVRAPFNGIITKITVKKGDSAGSGTAIATLITNQKNAVISLNEVDLARIKLGDKATILFDAIDGLTITGQVTEIDTIGTVSQGVVTYNVEISFDTQDDRVKAGMSMSATIITDVKPDVIIVPNSAIRSTSDGQRYVEIFDQPMPKGSTNQGTPSSFAPFQQDVEVGISNDTITEIISGIKVGDDVVTRTVAPSSQTTTQAPSIFGAVGGNRNTGGNAVRVRN